MKNDIESIVGEYGPGHIDPTTVAAEAAGLVNRLNSGGAVLDFDIAFDMYMAQNEKAWAHDRSLTVGASEVWQCLRAVWYAKRGHLFNIFPNEEDENWGAMERGNLIENHFVVPGLRLALPRMPTLPEGVELILGGSKQKTLVLGKNSATPDGVIRGLTPGPLTIRGGKQEIVIPDIKADCIILEIKSIDPRAVLLEERDKHHGQTQVQIGLIREMTDFKPYFSVVLYVDASFLTITPFVVEYDEKMYETAKLRAASVYEIDDPMRIMPEGRFHGECATCKWREPCGLAQIAAIPEAKKSANPEAIDQTEPLVQAYLQARRAYAAAEEQLEVAKDAIKESLLAHKTSSLNAPTWKASWYQVKGRTTLDQKKLAEAIDITPYMKEGLPHDQLRITEHLPDTAAKKPRKRQTKSE